MSLADELLATINDDVAIHDHIVSDSDSYFIIDPDSREITNAAAVKNTVMQFDHMSEIYTFEVPRYVEGHDMTLCNRARVHFINIDGANGTEHRDVAEMDDLRVDPEDENRVLSTWTIRREATQLAGNLSFAVQYMCVADDGEVVYEWHTDIYSDVDVKRTLNNSEAAVIEYTNILEEWYQKLFSGSNIGIGFNPIYYAGQLVYISKDGSLIPLQLGPGLKITNGVLSLNIASSESESISTIVDSEGIFRVYNAGSEVIPVVDENGTISWPGITVSVDSNGTLTFGV